MRGRFFSFLVAMLFALRATAQHAHDHLPAQAQEAQRPESSTEHAAPNPPAAPMHAMSYGEMAKLMQMDDTAAQGMFTADELEWRGADHDGAPAWKAHAWYGGDYDKLWLQSEGERREGSTETQFHLLWDHAFSRWWSLQSGLRLDNGRGPSRQWAAIGVRGLAPYWVELEAAAYIGDEGRTAARLKARYELLLTQRLILQPEAELSLYGKDDFSRRIAAGLSDAQVGVRLRYEWRRELAPYIGVLWVRELGETADLTRGAGEDPDLLEWVAGIRMWF